MNAKERVKFITQLVNDVKRDLIKESKKYPKEWNGLELRERIRDFFSQVVIKGTIGRTRKKEYTNYCLVNGFR